MILGFTGRARSGKSTAVSYLHFKSDRPRIRLNFKDALSNELRMHFSPLLTLFGEVYGMGMSELFSEKPPMMRKLMQLYGTEVRRGDDPDYWVKQWKKNFYKIDPKIDVMADDVRFLNEAQAIKQMGGKIIRIVRDDQEHTEGNHASEQEMEMIVPDYTIISKTGDLAGLYRQLDAILAELSTADHLSTIG